MVIANIDTNDCFYLKYHSESGQMDLYFKRVDRHRDLWVACIYEFIKVVRMYFKSEFTAATPTELASNLYLRTKKNSTKILAITKKITTKMRHKHF